MLCLSRALLYTADMVPCNKDGGLGCNVIGAINQDPFCFNKGILHRQNISIYNRLSWFDWLTKPCVAPGISMNDLNAKQMHRRCPENPICRPVYYFTLKCRLWWLMPRLTSTVLWHKAQLRDSDKYPLLLSHSLKSSPQPFTLGKGQGGY